MNTPTVRLSRDGEHHRQADWHAFACWQPSHVHAGPQLQTSPQWHDASDLASAFRQPHVQSEPLQAPQAHTFD